MKNIYTYTKMQYVKDDVKEMYLFFDNGDYLSIDGSEVVDIFVNVYDRLVWHHQGAAPVVASGFIKLKINEKHSSKYPSHFLYDQKEYNKNRKSYIENRCVQDSITKMWLFDENYWQKILLGNVQAKTDAEYLVLDFLPLASVGTATDTAHHICLPNIKREQITQIKLDFENCEVIELKRNEILEINLAMNEELSWGSSCLYRSIKSGFIKIQLDKRLGKRKNGIFDENLTTKQVERRICGKSGYCEHDLCHLYITYSHAGYASPRTECVEVDDIRSQEELDQIYDEDDFVPDYIGGYSAKLKDGSIIITFGKNSEDTLYKLIEADDRFIIG